VLLLTLFQSSDGQIEFALAWPGLPPLGVLWAELAPQSEADVFVKFLWPELRAFSWLFLLVGL
jgi:hypothetical protein